MSEKAANYLSVALSAAILIYALGDIFDMWDMKAGIVLPVAVLGVVIHGRRKSVRDDANG